MGGKQAKMMSSTNSSSLNNCSTSNTRDENYRPYNKTTHGQVKRKVSSMSSSNSKLRDSQSAFHIHNVDLSNGILVPLASSYRQLQHQDNNNSTKLQFTSQDDDSYNSNNNNNKPASPLRRFGLSPRFKRKIVEVISDNKVSQVKVVFCSC
jgi:hypothetical protein